MFYAIITEFSIDLGDDRTNPAKYHPFYITDNREGGFGQRPTEQQRQQRVFAGVSYDAEGFPYPTAGKQSIHLFYCYFYKGKLYYFA